MSQPSQGGPRSIGGSLLDRVLAETLDPAYAEAAAAREQAGPGDPGEPADPADPADPATASTARVRRLRGRVLVAAVLAVAGLLVALTYNQAAAGEKGRQQVRAALLSDIQRQQQTTGALATQLAALQRQVSDTRSRALAASEGGQEALNRLAAAERAAAAVPVGGPGLVVTLADAKPNADADPVGGHDTPDPRGLVRDGDLQVVVNALWAAGAEAVSINGQRVGPTTAIRFAGQAVLVDFNPVTSPYRVSAIGEPSALSRKFLASPDISSLAAVSESFGLRFDFAQEDKLSLPAASPIELRSARPLSPPAQSTASAPATGTASVPPRSTPGG